MAQAVNPRPGQKVVRPHWFQERTLHSRRRWIVMLGGTGGGKTWWGPVWLGDRIGRDLARGIPDGRYLVIGPTVDMVRDMLVPSLEAHYAGTSLEGLHEKARNIYHVGGQGGPRIYFRSADKPQRIEGHHVRGCWMDECGQMKALIWPIIRARTAFYRAPTLLTGYPWAMNWYYHDVYLPWKAGDKSIDVVQFASIDNPDYPREEFEDARSKLPAWLFEMRYLGIFRRPAGLVYPDLTDENNVVEPFEPDKDWPLYAGMDPGACFGVLFVYVHDGTWYIWREYYSEEVMGAGERARALLEVLEDRKPIAWIYDPARLQDVVDLGEHGIGPFHPAKNAVMAGIETLTSLVKPGKLKVMRGQAPNFMDQMGRYTFPVDPATGERKSENPIKLFDHLPDCARYIAHTLLGAPEESQETVIYYNPTRISPY